MSGRFEPGNLATLPPAARLYLSHAIAPGTPLAESVCLDTRFVMWLREDAERATELIGSELLETDRFHWRARARMGWLPIRVTDDYGGGEGSVRVELLGVVPIVRSSGPEVSRSARGRLAAEAIWLPSVLLPRPRVEWEQVGDYRARVTRVIDGESIALELEVNPSGRLERMRMLRYGDVGVDGWRPIPYGVEVEEEATFDGYTVPTRATGGWWFGSDRYDPSTASRFEIAAAEFR